MRWMEKIEWTLVAALALGIPGVAFADVPAGMTYDDGFTFFEMENFQGSSGGRPTDEGWALKAHVRVFGRVERGAMFHLVIKSGARTVGETRCEVSFEPDHDVAPSFFTRNCVDRDQRITGAGDFTVEVHLAAGGQEHLLRTHSLRVLTATRVRGNGDPDAPLHYADRNSEVLGSVLHLQASGTNSYLAATGEGQDRCGNCNRVTLVVNAHPDRAHSGSTRNTRMQCRVNGAPLPMEDTRVHAGHARMVYLVHSHGRGRMQEGEQEEVAFRQFHLLLPINFDSSIAQPVRSRQRDPRGRARGQAYLNDHPGQWECDWLDGATVLRTFSWTVGRDGRVQAHPETAAGRLTFGPNAYLVSTRIPAGGSVYDTRLHRESVVERAFYGLGWRTDAGRAMARAVPDFGAVAPPQPR